MGLMDEILLEPIGVVSNSIIDTGHRGWKDVYSDIFVKEEHIPALDGLAEFSHIIVFFWLHKTTPEERATGRERPKNKAEMPELGVFAWHSPRRPNPIGMSIVKLLEVQGNRVKVQGLDAIDQTPVLDLRPYIGSYYHVDGSTEPAWVARCLLLGS